MPTDIEQIQFQHRMSMQFTFAYLDPSQGRATQWDANSSLSQVSAEFGHHPFEAAIGKYFGEVRFRQFAGTDEESGMQFLYFSQMGNGGKVLGVQDVRFAGQS